MLQSAFLFLPFVAPGLINLFCLYLVRGRLGMVWTLVFRPFSVWALKSVSFQCMGTDVLPFLLSPFAH